MADADEPRPRRRSNPPTRKSLGQHFLSDPGILERIADALELHGGETVIEIGPGRGSLTDLLASRAARLIAIEYDRALAELLRVRYLTQPHVTIVQSDVLEVDLPQLGGDDYVVVGNVPYYITTPILFQALRAPMPRRAVYLIQREVADRLVADPGTSEYGALTVNVQAVAQVERLFRVPAGAFRPPPKVESAVVRVTPRDDPLIPPERQPALKELVQGAFGMRRKQMRRVVRELFGLTAEEAEQLLGQAGIDPDVRPETLTAFQFAELLSLLLQGPGPRYQGPGPRDQGPGKD
jgi:16S rRNA (adenine1518-N6/adenine1519-N6)-dimethyltransferase